MPAAAVPNISRQTYRFPRFGLDMPSRQNRPVLYLEGGRREDAVKAHSACSTLSAQHPAMRLSPDHARAIVTATRVVAGGHARVKLFGSRLDDNTRGGDVALLVELPEPVDQRARLTALVAAGVLRVQGDRKVDDFVLFDPSADLQPMHRVAQQNGLVLS